MKEQEWEWVTRNGEKGLRRSNGVLVYEEEDIIHTLQNLRTRKNSYETPARWQSDIDKFLKGLSMFHKRKRETEKSS